MMVLNPELGMYSMKFYIAQIYGTVWQGTSQPYIVKNKFFCFVAVGYFCELKILICYRISINRSPFLSNSVNRNSLKSTTSIYYRELELSFKSIQQTPRAVRGEAKGGVHTTGAETGSGAADRSPR